ncbi:unnamed protein product, partial [Polarella glacialis]
QSNSDGTFNVRHAPGQWENYVRRARIRGPGIALLVENGPRIVATCATLPTFKRSCYFQGNQAGVQNNKLYNSGIGSPDWVLKRWFPNAVRIQSEWVHRRHPCILKQDWYHIKGEKKADDGNKKTINVRIRKALELIEEQGPNVRTLVFCNTPETCVAFEMALKGAKIESASVHAGIPFSERLDGLKKFGTGE